ncbi:hypothetical protein HOY82DRAFT_542698 [Tuber indicum]|nr:hypothetical protein HOY82DRAFT_542698 [Tuber indicum]
MSQILTAHSIWSTEETEALIEWLEEPANLRKAKKGSGVVKKQIVKEIVAKITTKPEVKVGYKYDNLLKSYREAVKMNSQSGWGLSGEDLDEGKKTLREKILSRCPFFFRLEAIFGNHPNIRPPAHYNSGSNLEEAASAVKRLLDVIGSGREDEDIEEEENEVGCEERSLNEKGKGKEIQAEEEGISQYEQDFWEEQESQKPTGEEEFLVIGDSEGEEVRSWNREEIGESSQHNVGQGMYINQ